MTKSFEAAQDRLFMGKPFRPRDLLAEVSALLAA